MYIPPFLAGVICTVLAEIMAIIVAVILSGPKK